MATVHRATSQNSTVRWLFALSIAISSPLAADANAAEAAAVVPATSEEPQRSLSFRVTVEAPSPLKETLERDVGLVRWQRYADMTDDLLDHLAREAIDEVRGMAAAEGFFSAVIDVRIDRTKDPVAVTLSVDVGPATHISSVQIAVTGPAATDTPLGTDAIARLRSGWSLPEGVMFRQAAWTIAKERALATLAGSPYAAARIVKSEAAIDPDQRSADLALELASGPAFRFGQFEIAGLHKYDASLVRNFSTITPGEPYSDARLNQYVRRLNASGYFASVQAKIDPETAHPEDATVDISVIEARPKRFEGGIGYSTDVQFRTNANYRDVNFDGNGLQFVADARLETKIQSGSVKFSRPPNASGWIASYFAGAERTDIESLVTRTAAAGTRWHTIEERDEHALSATYYLDEQQPDGSPNQTANALYAEYERHWRRVDDLIAPTTGWMASVFAGGGVPGVSSRTFGRLRGRFAAWVPIGANYELNVRAEGGAVIAGGRDGIPSTLLFRTGGSTTVRGYDFDSLGVDQNGAVVPGRYYAVASVDATRWIGDAWGVAAFIDAGNAIDSWSDAHLALGYGIGARVRTPLGPFRLDVAYGRDVQKVRLQFSVGLTF
jgi:translocation and assembly module TamA